MAETPTSGRLKRVTDFRVLVPKWDVFIIAFPQGSGIYAEDDAERSQKLEVIYDSKEIAFSRPSRTEAHMDSEPVAACI